MLCKYNFTMSYKIYMNKNIIRILNNDQNLFIEYYFKQFRSLFKHYYWPDNVTTYKTQ